MSDNSKLSNSEDEEVISNTLAPSSSKIIVIPTVENSESDDEDNLPSFRRKASSEGSEGEEPEPLQELSEFSTTRPTHLLKTTRRQARDFDRKGELELAVKKRIKCLAYSRLVFGDGHWQLAKAYGKLGEAYLKRTGFYQQALLHATRGRDELLQGESDEYRSNRLSHSNDVLGVMELVYFVMGKASFLLGEFRKAEQAFKKAEISSKERVKFENGQISETNIKILESLGQVCCKLKKCDAGVEYYEKALKQAKKIYGKTGKELIPLYQGLGKAYHQQQGDFNKRKGVEMFAKCYELAEKNFHEGSVELADVIYSTTTACRGTGESDPGSQTQNHLEKCLEIYKNHYGPDHKKTIKVQEELCRLLLCNGDHEEAAGIIREVITSKMMVFGDPSVSLAESYQLLGTIRLSQGITDKALKHFEKCQSMLSCVLGKNHKKTIQITETLNMVKKTPGALKFQSPAEKLKDRPRFNGTVGRSSSLGASSSVLS